MKPDYLKFVQWNEPDGLFVGYCPDLFIGGICHGADEAKVYGQLCALVAGEIKQRQSTNSPLPEKAASVMVPVAT
jgi:hypothetical protein